MLRGFAPGAAEPVDDRPAPPLTPVKAAAEAPIRVGVNLLWCVPGQVGGSEQYLVRQLLGLRECRANVALTVYGSGAFEAAHDDVATLGKYVVAPVDGRRRWRRVVTEARWLRARTRAARQRLAHHGGGTAPWGAPTPYVLTVHDLQYRTFPEHFSPVKRRYLDAMIPRSVRDAAVVTVPSEFVRRSLIEEMDAAPGKVVIVPHGYEPALLTARTPDDELRRTYALGGGPFVVYPAITHPHKNHRLLVELLAGPWADTDLRVVLLGGKGAAEDDLVRGIASSGAGAGGRIVRVGRVSDADRNGLLAASEALVFPSTYEGFGAPLIEAMALGTPVLCSDAACIPEVVGDAALVRPPTIDGWADALDEVRARRAQLVERGRERVQQFTSLESGRALEAAYRLAVGG